MIRRARAGSVGACAPPSPGTSVRFAPSAPPPARGVQGVRKQKGNRALAGTMLAVRCRSQRIMLLLSWYFEAHRARWQHDEQQRCAAGMLGCTLSCDRSRSQVTVSPQMVGRFASALEQIARKLRWQSPSGSFLARSSLRFLLEGMKAACLLAACSQIRVEQ